MGIEFMGQISKNGLLHDYKVYSIVACKNDNEGGYNIFLGVVDEIANAADFSTRIVKSNLYAKFKFRGNAFDINDFFSDNFYKWVVSKEVKLLDNEIGMLMISNPAVTDEVEIWIPIAGN